MTAGAGAVLGILETQAAKDDKHILNKVPRPIKQLGYTGGTALAAWVAYKFTGFRPLRYIVEAALPVAAYQAGRLGFSDFSGKDAAKALTVSGWDDMDGIEHLLGDDEIGAIEAEGSYVGDDDMGDYLGDETHMPISHELKDPYLHAGHD